MFGSGSIGWDSDRDRDRVRLTLKQWPFSDLDNPYYLHLELSFESAIDNNFKLSNLNLSSSHQISR